MRLFARDTNNLRAHGDQISLVLEAGAQFRSLHVLVAYEDKYNHLSDFGRTNPIGLFGSTAAAVFPLYFQRGTLPSKLLKRQRQLRNDTPHRDPGHSRSTISIASSARTNRGESADIARRVGPSGAVT
jgi:hypothetical protein